MGEWGSGEVGAVSVCACAHAALAAVMPGFFDLSPRVSRHSCRLPPLADLVFSFRSHSRLADRRRPVDTEACKILIVVSWVFACLEHAKTMRSLCLNTPGSASLMMTTVNQPTALECRRCRHELVRKCRLWFPYTLHFQLHVAII